MQATIEVTAEATPTLRDALKGVERGLPEAAEGTRTLDLLHGKQTL